MKAIFLFVLVLQAVTGSAQNDSVKAVTAIRAFQKTLNDEYRNPEESPLEPKDLKQFKGHAFFPIDLAYRVTAQLTVLSESSFFPLKTSTTQLHNYRIYGYLEFTLKGKTFRLPVYQSQALMQRAEYADYLFFPFSDETNGRKSYGGGRFIDLRIPPAGEHTIVIDFNQAYNPYCAYSHRYACPIVPEANQLDIEVPAGVMLVSEK